MENEKSFKSTLTHEVLAPHTIVDLGKKVPRDIHIDYINFRCYIHRDRQKLLIPEYLRKKGVASCTQSSGDIDIVCSRSNITNIKNLVNDAKRIATSYHVPLDKFVVRSVTFRNKQGEASFRRMFKQIRFPSDKRRKMLVLGFTKGHGNYHSLLDKLSTRTIICTLAKVEKTIVMCSEEKK